jgi:lipopolysaccharide export system permease protein
MNILRFWRRVPLLDRWLLQELAGPLMFGIAAFTAVSLSVGVVFELVRNVAESGLPVVMAMQVLLYRSPEFLVLSFPMGTLMATLQGYSRLSGDSELTALRSIGVGTLRMVAPALVLALVMSLLTFVFNDMIVPRANFQAKYTFERGLGRAISATTGEYILHSNFGDRLNADGGREHDLTQLFYARRFVNGEMQDVTLLDFSRTGQRQMLQASRGTWNDQKGMWEFFDGRITNIDLQGNELTTTARFDRYLYPFGKDPVRVAELPRDASVMTVAEARSAERLLSSSGNQLEARRMRVRIHEKFSFPTICLVFGLIGSSLGVRPNNRTSRSQGFGISVILIFTYYLMSYIFSFMGVKGSIIPFGAAWFPVLIGLSGGLYLLRQASR